MRVWVASLIFYSAVFAICEVLRFLILTLVPGDSKRLTTQLLLEFVGTLQICTPMFDVGTIMDTYGLPGVFVEITVIEIANYVFLRDAVGHPCPLMTCCYRKWKLLRRALYVFCTQLLAAMLSFHLARLFWRLHIHPKHTELLEDNSTCTADLTVTLWIGAAVEGAATYLGKAFEQWSSDRYADTRMCTLINCLFSGLVCAIGINYTGMYANPIVAWACTFNCEGVSHIGHLIVYWLSPLLAWYAAELSFGHDDELETSCQADEAVTVKTKEAKKIE